MTQLLQEKQSLLLAALALMMLVEAPAWAAPQDQGGLAEASQDVEKESEDKAAAEAAARAAAEVPLADQPVPTRFGTNLPAQAPGYQGVEPGGEYTIDVDSQTWTDETGQKVKLPFDVPFVVKGSVDNGTTSVQARFVEFNKPPDCLGLFRRTRFKVAWEDPFLRDVPVRVRKSARPIEKTEPVTGFISGTGDARVFRVELLPLRPNRYYCFEFALSGELSEEQQKAVRNSFRVAIDQELREPAYQGTTTVAGVSAPIVDITTLAQYEEFRRDLRLLLEDLVEQPREIKVEVGSFFDHDTPYAELDDAYKDEVDAVLRQQEDARHAFGNYHSQATNAAQNLLVARDAKYAVPDGGDRSLFELLSAVGLDATARVRLTGTTEDTGFDLLQLFDIREGTASTRGQMRSLARGLRTGAEDPWTEVFSIPKKSDLNDRIETLNKLSTAVKVVPELFEVAGIDMSNITRQDPEDPDAGLKTDIAAISLALDDAVDWLENLQDFPQVRAQLIDKMLQALMVEVRKVLTIGGSTIADYNTRAIWYMSADLGAGLSVDTEDFFTYVGWNIYLRPVNKKALLSWPGRPFTLREEFLRRFSFTLGVVQSGFDEEPGRIEGVIGNNAALVGAGFRINDSLRLSVGGMVFESQDPSPLISTTELNWSPYVALSVDWNAAKTFGRIFP